MTVTVDDAEKLQGAVSSIWSIDLPRLTKYVSIDVDVMGLGN